MTGRCIALLCGLAAAWLLLAAPPAAAEDLVADLSDHLIAITTGFTGTEVVMFGATEGTGDVIIIVRGPLSDVTVRRKARVAGIWVNRDRMVFTNVPSYYALASSRPVDEVASPATLELHEIGFDHLKLAVASDVNPTDVPFFRAALIREKQLLGLYVRQAGKVSFLGTRLFRTNFYFPADVPTGSYLAEVLLVRNGQVASAQTTPLIISKIGVGATIFDFAHQEGAFYGAIAILVALMAGWIAHLAFRRG
jgi:uncharacterized protein (TIGR02186 family)